MIIALDSNGGTARGLGTPPFARQQALADPTLANPLVFPVAAADACG
jgi:hypothetical protein